MTLDDFFNVPRACIHCKTEQEAAQLIRAFSERGKKWCNGNNYIPDTMHWEEYGEATCYTNDGHYCSVEFFIRNLYQILEFEDIAKFTTVDLYESDEIDEFLESVVIN